MTIVLDTNILLVCLAKISKYRVIFDALLAGRFTLAISNEILHEYTEILQLKTNQTIANNVAQLLLNLPNTTKIEVYYRWSLIKQDSDDNKFVDCAIAANADYIVTNDRHFQELNRIGFPKVEVLSAADFLSKINDLLIA